MDKAAIMGSLVDVRNVGTHKSVKLTIHVPAEHATQVFAAFGWPTGAEPVTVAIARLVEEKVLEPGDIVGTYDQCRLPYKKDERKVVQTEGQKSISRPDTPPASEPDKPPARAHKPVAPEKRLAQQAGIACADPLFWKFLNHNAHCDDENTAAAVVRWICQVGSRSEITPGSSAAESWNKLYTDFILWRDHPDLSPDATAEREEVVG